MIWLTKSVKKEYKTKALTIVKRTFVNNSIDVKPF